LAAAAADTFAKESEVLVETKAQLEAMLRR